MKIDSQHFLYLDPYTTTQIEMVNVLVSFTSSSNLNEKKILLLAHYDSRPRAENALDSSRINQPIDGANDGASGVAVLMEIANILSKKAPSIDVDFVFVDGEDWGKVGDNENYLLGSKEYARQSIRDKYRFGIVIDMIGDSQQQIYREASSLSLNVAGIPSAVIIDFDYEYWHTEYDTPDKCSAQSLENVGKLLLEIIYNESLWPKK
jgi:Zn-dependent M28 family amino/carboxypeptidase